METLAAKIVIAFFYMVNGDLVSYTVSDFEAFAQEERLPTGLTCATLIQNVRFIEDVRRDLTPGESMRAACFTTDDLMVLGEPDVNVEINRN